MLAKPFQVRVTPMLLTKATHFAVSPKAAAKFRINRGG